MDSRLNNFEVLHILGSGAYSSVYQAKRKSDGQLYALKRVKLFDVGEREKQNALNEVRIIASIQHPNIVSYKECFLETPNGSNPELCIIMEYADEGDLLQRIQKQMKLQQYITEREIWNILIQVILGLKALHDKKIFHRDLKCANIFLFGDQRVKLGDFNVSKLAKKGLVYTQTGTPYYASPEVWQDKPYDHKADIWSMGCVIYEACTLKPPFRAKDMDGLYKAIMKGQYVPLPAVYSQEIQNVIKMMIQVRSDLRPDCEQLLQQTAIFKRVQANSYKITDIDSQQELLKTIKWPSSKKSLQQHKSEVLQINQQLPASNYNSNNNIKQSLQIGNNNHLKRHGFQNQPSNRIKSQEIQESINQVNSTNFSIQNIINQIGKIQNTPNSNEPYEKSALIQILSENSTPTSKNKDQKKNKHNHQDQPSKSTRKIKSKLKLYIIKKIATDPHGLGQQRIDSSRMNNLIGVVHGSHGSQNLSRLNAQDYSSEVVADGKIIQENRKKIEIVDRRVRVHNSQYEKQDQSEQLGSEELIIINNKKSKERGHKIQIDNTIEIGRNYYVREVNSSIYKQQSQKLPALYSKNYSQNRQQSSNDGKSIVEEAYQLESSSNDLQGSYRKNSESSEKKILIKAIKNKPYLVNEMKRERSNYSVTNISGVNNSVEKLKKLSELPLLKPSNDRPQVSAKPIKSRN